MCIKSVMARALCGRESESFPWFRIARCDIHRITHFNEILQLFARSLQLLFYRRDPFEPNDMPRRRIVMAANRRKGMYRLRN